MPAGADAFDLKGKVLSLTVLRLRTSDASRIEPQLAQRVSQLPQFFRNAPVVIDCEALATEGIDFEALSALLQRCALVPVAVCGVTAEQQAAALGAGFGVIDTEVRRPATPRPAERRTEPRQTERPAGPAVNTPPPASTPTLTITQPVRSGRVIYAQHTDLVVMAAVNAGGEVIADEHIHVYGPLRGRALAGASGNQQARIFCQRLEAELVSVAGQYLRAEDLDPQLLGKPAQVFIKDGSLLVDAL
jgi:septum site-determining protein MinC